MGRKEKWQVEATPKFQRNRDVARRSEAFYEALRGRWPVVQTGVVGCKVRRHQRLSEAGVELLKKGTREVLRQDDCVENGIQQLGKLGLA